MKNEHRNEHILHLHITGMKKRYSNPKLYVPKVNGRATIEKGKRWYVYFYWRTDPEGVLNKRFTFYKDLNRLNTTKERRKMGKALAGALKLALSKGWNPDTNKTEKKKTIKTVDEALKFALSIKKENLKEATVNDYIFRSGIFLKWLKKNGIDKLPIDEININHVYDFLDYLQLDYKKDNGQKLSNNSIDNTKRVISSLFTELKNKRMISHNFVKDIPKLKGKAKKNKPFTPSELSEIKRELQKEDPYLIGFLNFMIYPVLRPREIVRLKVQNINMQDWLIMVETKTRDFAISRIISKMKPAILSMELDRFGKECNVFSPENKPAVWHTKRIDSKVSYFSKRFTKVIRKMGFGNDYTLYSVRHTAIWSLYNGLQKQGKNEREIIQNLMPITGHKSEAGLRNYLREIQVIIPPDHSDIYDFDF